MSPQLELYVFQDELMREIDLGFGKGRLWGVLTPGRCVVDDPLQTPVFSPESLLRRTMMRVRIGIMSTRRGKKNPAIHYSTLMGRGGLLEDLGVDVEAS